MILHIKAAERKSWRPWARISLRQWTVKVQGAKHFLKALLLVALLSVFWLAQGCIVGPSHGREAEEISVRTNANGQVIEKLIRKVSYWEYGNLLTPEGPQTRQFARSCRYFLTDQHGKQIELKFFRPSESDPELYTAMSIFKPINGTNYWLRLDRLEDKHWREDSSTDCTLVVSVFNDQGIRHKRTIETSEYISSFSDTKRLKFGPGNQTVRWDTEKNHFSYDVMKDILTGPNTAQSMEKK